MSRLDDAKYPESVRSSIFSRSIIRRDNRDQESSEGPKGPLGLTTLFEPEEAYVDIIFVHGLNGGSFSTWTKNGDESLFWPRTWLPSDDSFSHVRIHTFGYSSGVSQESVLNIQDFARGLLAAVQDSPKIPRSESVPLIFVGHSMGGLVIKKAFVLGQHTPEFESIVDRTFAIVFLGTPHLGAGIAQSLNRLLALAPGPRSFVPDLFPDSPMLQAINSDFPRYSDRLKLLSFYETKPMSWGVGRGLIVEKQCAVLNYVNERRTHLDANHRDLARFNSRHDPSYISVRNALAALVGDGQQSQTEQRRQLRGDQVEALSTFLGAFEPEDDLAHLDSQRFPGTCDWFLEKPSYSLWVQSVQSRTLWLQGRPGVGKSFLAGHVVNHLRKNGNDCCWHFFTQGDKTRVSVNSVLRSLAWQMACLHSECFDAILDVAANWREAAASKVDPGPIWRRIFHGGLLRVSLSRPQYWILDALDECDGTTSELMAFIVRAQQFWPLHVLVTSRTAYEVHMDNIQDRDSVILDTVSEEDSGKDVEMFLRYQLPPDSTGSRTELAEEILEKSNGIFLWVGLILRELRQVHTEAEMKEVLRSNPSDMDSLYRKLLDDMSNRTYGKALAKSILTWTVCAARPMATKELHQAIELTINDRIDDVERCIRSCCGNLVYTDHLNKVKLIHLTARAFLTRKDLGSEFAIERASGHKSLAMVCLRHLSQADRKVPHYRKPSVDNEDEEQRNNALTDYANTFLFHHLANVKSDDDAVFLAMARFLRSASILSWVEYIATHSDLQKIYQAGKVISNLLQRRARHSPPLGLNQDYTLVERWSNDLTHLVTKFGKQLVAAPISIHHLIPAFCPPESALRQQFSSKRSGLIVQGLSATRWDDCLSIMTYARGAEPLCTCSCDKFVASGLSTGTIIVHDDLIFQEIVQFDHREPVWCIAFSESGSLLASAGPKTISVWDVEERSKLYKIQTKHLCMDISFSEQDCFLVAASRDSKVCFYDLTDGSMDGEPLDYSQAAEDLGLAFLQERRPTGGFLNARQGIMGIVYRGEALILWDLANNTLFDIYDKETGSRSLGLGEENSGSTWVWHLAFNLNPESSLLAVAYSDGDLVVYDTHFFDVGSRCGTVCAKLRNVNAQKVASSPDGRTLAVADSKGTIQLFDFGTLKFLYRINLEDDARGTKALCFAADSHHLLDVRETQTIVWDPTVLLRQDTDDEYSDTVSVTTGPQEVDFRGIDSAHITAITCVKALPVLFAGKEDGSVHVFDISGEPQGWYLFTQTEGARINLLHFAFGEKILTCSDSASRVTSCKIVRKPGNDWEIGDTLLDVRLGSIVTRIVSYRSSRLLIVTDQAATLWALPHVQGSSFQKQRTLDSPGHWVATSSNQLVFIQATVATVFSWDTLEPVSVIELTGLSQPLDFRHGVVDINDALNFISWTTKLSPDGSKTVQLWQTTDLKAQQTAQPASDSSVAETRIAAFTHSLGMLPDAIKSAIGIIDSRFVFLNSDHWVCSIDLKPTVPGPAYANAVRHFYLPDDWVTMVNDLVFDTGGRGEIVFAKRSELAVIRRGLEVTDKGAFTSPKRPDLFGRKRSVPTRPASRPLQGPRGPISNSM